jgi:hypothetical protein
MLSKIMLYRIAEFEWAEEQADQAIREEEDAQRAESDVTVDLPPSITLPPSVTTGTSSEAERVSTRTEDLLTQGN